MYKRLQIAQSSGISQSHWAKFCRQLTVKNSACTASVCVFLCVCMHKAAYYRERLWTLLFGLRCNRQSRCWICLWGFGFAESPAASYTAFRDHSVFADVDEKANKYFTLNDYLLSVFLIFTTLLPVTAFVHICELSFDCWHCPAVLAATWMFEINISEVWHECWWQL